MGTGEYNPPELDRWITLETYKALIDSATSHLAGTGVTDSRSNSLVGQPVLILGGMVKADGQLILDPYYLMPDGTPTDLPSDGDVLIQLRGPNNELLYQGGLPSSMAFTDSNAPPLGAVPLAVAVPFPANTRYVVITLFGQELDRRIVSLNPPTITILSPQPGQTIDRQIDVSWQASDPDGDPIKVAVLLSSDGGQTWQTLTMDVEGNSYSIDTTPLQAGNSYWIKLIATDGVRTGVATSGPFRVLKNVYLPLIVRNAGTSGQPTPTPGPSPAGQILFTSGTSWDQPHDIYVMNEDGTNVRRLTHGPGSSINGRFSPDGSKIVFASDRSGDWYIYTMKADGTDVQQLAPAGYRAAPDWSPDGTRIVYKCPPKGLCVMNADGTNIRRLTSTYDGWPRWSHDGNRIAFSSWRDGGWEIYVMSADGSNQTNLTRNPDTTDVKPAWSPDDTKIAFEHFTQAYHDYIFVMISDGTGAYPITSDEHNQHPVWSPDGTRIAFSSNRGEQLRNVYVMNADGSNASRLTERDDWPTDWR